ncbi:hypothetical protein, partial [Microbacterium sp. KNMS]
MFRLRDLRFPILEGRILRGYGPGVGVRSVYGGRIDVQGSNLPAGDGYLVILTQSQYCDVNVHATRVRHAYSDSTNWVESGSTDIGGYGRTMFNRISGFAVSTHETAF